ncbi:MAG: NPCBM/NEW2 domain-containing protein [Verrucomicrobia bacterium]|nr:NPCBM/NEW2 domain-containing protein [Verrucomicrobiota bacterium]
MLRATLVSAVTLILLAAVPASGTTFDRFVARIAVDDGCKGRSGESIFRVQLDGTEVFKSRVFLPGDDPESIDIPLDQAGTLSLIIDDEGDGHGGDWGNWLDARLVDSKTGEFMFLTDLDPEEVDAWIPPIKDRNIIARTIAVNDTVYLRGWGGISGSHNLFRDWNTVAAEHEATRDQANVDAATRSGELHLGATDPLPEGLKLVLDGTELTERELKKGVTLKPASRLVVTTNLTDPAHTAFWRDGACTVSGGGQALALVDLVQPSERLVHADVQPNRNVLTGNAAPEPQGILAGMLMPAAGPMTFTLRDLHVAFERAQFKHEEGSILLLVRARQYKTTEVPKPAAITSARLTVEIDGRPLAHVFSDNARSWEQSIALSTWPNRIECFAAPGADGSMGDGFAIDFGLQSPELGVPLWVRSIQPTMQIFTYDSPEQLLVAAAWKIPAWGVVRWDGLGDELARRKAGADALEAVKEKLELKDYRKQIEDGIAVMLQLSPSMHERQGKALAAELIRKDPNLRSRIDAVTDEVLKHDPRQPDIRIAAAERLRQLGNLMQERRQWGLLIEECRADLDLMIRARARIDAIWDEADPEPFPYPDDGSPTRSSRALGNTWLGAGEFYNHIWTIELSKDSNWTAELTLPDKNTGRLAVMVNSRGIEVTATLAGEKPLATRTAQHPVIEATILDGNKVMDGKRPLTLTISQDPDVTGIILPHTVEVVAWEMNSEADAPIENWQIAFRDDGSATVSRTSRAPVLAAIPRGATNLVVEGCTGYTIQEAITEYLVGWDGRLGGAGLPLFVAPKPGEEIRISYEWPEAAYNVPMSKYNWSGRREHVYFRSPAGILDTKALSTWRITDVPKTWRNERWTPEPSNETERVFRVSPKGQLEAVWRADNVLTRWMSMEYRGLVAFMPDTPNNRRWFHFYMDYVRTIYDKQIEYTGHHRPYALYVGVQDASMLSGYGGGTLGDRNGSETWIPASHRMAPCQWRHGSNPLLVDSHELHWVTITAMVRGVPAWADNGFAMGTEEIGWRVTEMADSDGARRRNTARALAMLEEVKELGSNPIQLPPDEYNKQPGTMRAKTDALCWYIVDQIVEAYGADFWSRFYAEQRRLNADVYRVMGNQAKQILFVDELVRVSGDQNLGKRFTDEWLFDLTPDPQDAADRFLILPRQPRVFMGDSPDFSAPEFDDLTWAVAAAPSEWENPGPGPWGEKVREFDGQAGTAWYRFTFDVPADFKTDNLELRLGEIRAADETYVNGTKIGATGAFPPEFKDAGDDERIYAVPAELLKPGARNVVAIRIYCESDRGGPDRRPVLVAVIKEAE